MAWCQRQLLIIACQVYPTSPITTVEKGQFSNSVSLMPGITRRTVISLVNGISKLPDCCVRNISLAEMYAADEVFTTGESYVDIFPLCLCAMCEGSMGELTPVNEIDGRPIGYMYTDKTKIPSFLPPLRRQNWMLFVRGL